MGEDRVLRRDRQATVLRSCGHPEGISVGRCTDAVMVETMERESQKPCRACLVASFGNRSQEARLRDRSLWD